MESAARSEPLDVAVGRSNHRIPAELRNATLLGAALASALFFAVLANWSVHLQPTRYTGDFYDIQARRLFDGHLSVPLERIGLEAFRDGDSYHLYFGLFPTVLRMPLLALTDRFDGRLTQPSMALAWVVHLAALRGLGWHARRLVRGGLDVCPVDVIDRVAAAGIPLLAGVATPVLFLASVSAVYHEAALWGLAASLYAFHRLFFAVADPHRRNIVVFGAAATIAMSARATVGVGPCLAAFILAVGSVLAGRTHTPARLRGASSRLRAWADARELSTRRACGLLAAAVIPMLVHVAVNEARFSTPFSPPFARNVWTEISEERRAALEANDGSLFNVRYLPSTTLAYLRPDGVQLSRLFPYVWFDPPARVVGDVVFENRDRTASLTAISPVLVLAAVAGALAWVKRLRRRASGALFALTTLTAVGSTGGVLTIGFIAQRFTGDLLVPATLLALPGAYVALDWWTNRSARIRRLAGGGAAALVLWSCWANLSIALLYQRLYVPSYEPDRPAFVELQIAMQRGLPGSISYAQASRRPEELAPAGSFHVVGECASLWWSDGTMWIELEPLVTGDTALCRKLVTQ